MQRDISLEDPLLPKHSSPLLFFCFWVLIWKMRDPKERKETSSKIYVRWFLFVWLVGFCFFLQDCFDTKEENNTQVPFSL